MASDERAGRLLMFAPPATLSLFEYWEQNEPDFEEVVNLLLRLEQDDWITSNLDPNVYSGLRHEMFEQLANSAYYRDFAQIC